MQISSSDDKTIPHALRAWLFDSGSLTERLKKTFPEPFQVMVLFHDWGQAQEDEQLLLDAAGRTLVREVVLHCHGVPLVFARSIIPEHTISQGNDDLLCLGTRPLGAHLFANPALKRGPFQQIKLSVPELKARYLEVFSGMPQDDLWGRRSVFQLNAQPLLVSEFFLPNFLSQLALVEAKQLAPTPGDA